jgi:hypothetical protein
MHGYLFNTSFNSISTVLSNLYLTMHTSALRLYHYLRDLSTKKPPPSTLIIGKYTNLSHPSYQVLHVAQASPGPEILPRRIQRKLHAAQGHTTPRCGWAFL